MTESVSTTARRALRGKTDKGDVEIAVTIFAPTADGANWSCVYEIEWPDLTRRNTALGVDPMQALILAQQLVGAGLYAARPGQIQTLDWLADDGSLGFPLPPSLRGFARGDDKLI